MAAIYPPELSHLSLDMRRTIRAQCGKDWRRVTVDARGSVVVHNSPRPDGLRLRPPAKRAAATARRTAAAAPAPLSAPRASEQTIVVPVPVTPKVRTAPPPPPPSPRVFQPPPSPPPRVFQQEPTTPPLPQTPVRFSALREPARQAPQAPVPTQWILLPGQNPDTWTGEQFEQNAWRLQARISKGVGPDMPLKFFDEVTALHGVDLDMVESVVRQADKVTVDGSTATRKYPVLHFQRGDVLVVVGFRSDIPMIVAAYFNGAWASNIPSGRGSRRAGGGGARKATGLPTSVHVLMSRLRDCGAEITEDREGNTAEVCFRGQSLGRIQIGIRATKDTCQSDYQRCIRKIDSIKRKVPST